MRIKGGGVMGRSPTPQMAMKREHLYYMPPFRVTVFEFVEKKQRWNSLPQMTLKLRLIQISICTLPTGLVSLMTC